MTTYLVTWTIDIDADNPVEAAREARAAQRRAGSIATVFDVRSPDGATQTVDLTQVDGRVIAFMARVDAEMARARAAGMPLTTGEAIGQVIAAGDRFDEEQPLRS